jgi:DNA-binding transcriptional LysR family regulator
MPPLLSEFARSHPGVQLEFREAEQHVLREALDVGDIDVAFVYDSPVHDTPQRLTVRELTPHVILPLGHRLAGHGPLALEDLLDDELILLDTAPTADRTIALFSMLGLRAPVAYRTASIDAVRTLVGRGLGFAILAQRSASSMTTDGRQLVRAEITPAPTSMAVNMIWPERSENSRHVRALMAFAEDNGWGGAGGAERDAADLVESDQ